jgi:hypothetical protein
MRLRTPLAWYHARVEPSLDRRDRAFISACERKVRAEKVDAALGVTREHTQQIRRYQPQKARSARAARYCTKHMIVTTPLGGPERLIWVLGQHRTRGNACDGPEHRRQLAARFFLW